MREINLDEPLTEDEKGWLRQRDRHADVEANEAKFPGGKKPKAKHVKESEPVEDPEDDDTDDDTEEESEEPTDDYDSWKKAELAEECGKRDPIIDLSGDEKKKDIIDLLRAWDAEHGDDEDAE